MDVHVHVHVHVLRMRTRICAHSSIFEHVTYLVAHLFCPVKCALCSRATKWAIICFREGMRWTVCDEMHLLQSYLVRRLQVAGYSRLQVAE